jgi:hypothetical protein
MAVINPPNTGDLFVHHITRASQLGHQIWIYSRADSVEPRWKPIELGGRHEIVAGHSFVLHLDKGGAPGWLRESNYHTKH